MDRSRVAIVIPALNEAATIGEVVRSARVHGEVWVVDDGSSDDTGAVARAMGAYVERHPLRRGYDQALQSGFRAANAAGCACMLTLDADGQHDPALIQRFIAGIDAGADIVVGVRDRRQRISEHLFSWIARPLWGVRDPLCGMKAYRSEIYRELGHFDSYGSIGTELWLYAASTGRKIAQVDIPTRPRVDKKPRFGSVLRSNWLIMRALAYAIWHALARTHARARSGA
jgi:glycosyltransferase involved in cell wall biosynthesis